MTEKELAVKLDIDDLHYQDEDGNIESWRVALVLEKIIFVLARFLIVCSKKFLSESELNYIVTGNDELNYYTQDNA